MEKTLDITLDGKIYTMEEEAYLNVEDYLERLRQHIQDATQRSSILSETERKLSLLCDERMIGNTIHTFTVQEMDEILVSLHKNTSFKKSKQQPHKPTSIPHDLKSILKMMRGAIIGSFTALFKLSGGCLGCLGALILLPLFGLLLGGAFSLISEFLIFNPFSDNQLNSLGMGLCISIFLLVGIPIFTGIYALLSVLFHWKTLGRVVLLVLVLLWISSILSFFLI